ncbi:hypothetical protein DSO57_1006778 [Entomophthora muscae]|uniref:Uncharacterized protein n=1 Tax=Entomophthora muscae TaxID=34485 RepID=A0ACC2S9M8_9FUNG|nr:hypothetical protein DSO57_1006778 [Entomophthora muscae]
MDPDASPERYLPGKEEVNKDLIHQVLAVNAVTRRQAIQPKALLLREAIETVTLPYAEQLSHSSSEVTHEIQVSIILDTLKALKPKPNSALEAFFAQFKGLDVHKVKKILSPDYGDQHDCTYIKLVVHKLRVRTILDPGAPGKIVSTRMVKKLKLAPDLDYKEEVVTYGPNKTKALGAYSFLLLHFCKLLATAPAIVLQITSYNILIGTSFMATYETIIKHKDSNFIILGHSVPMFYHGDGLKDLPTRKIHYINMEYADSDLPVAYNLHQRKLKTIPLATKE